MGGRRWTVVSAYNTESSWTQEESKAASFNGVTRAKQSLKASACSNNAESLEQDTAWAPQEKRDGGRDGRVGRGEYSMNRDIEKGHNPSSPHLHWLYLGNRASISTPSGLAVSFVLLYILPTHCERKTEQVGMGIILSLSKMSKMTISVCGEVSVHSDLGFFFPDSN